MDVNKILTYMMAILFNPKDTLKKIKSVKFEMLDIVIYLCIANILTFIGLFIGHISYWHASISGSFLLSLIVYFTMIFGIIIGSFLLTNISEKYDMKVNQMKLLTLLTLSLTPSLIAGIINIYKNIFPFRIIGILALVYGMYIYYNGLGIVLEMPDSQKNKFFQISLIVIIIGWILMLIIWEGTDIIFSDLLYGGIHDYGYYDYIEPI